MTSHETVARTAAKAGAVLGLLASRPAAGRPAGPLQPQVPGWALGLTPDARLNRRQP